ncbi:MAG: transposase [Candidatus Omnitrophica bacterium]|nr:transposase [Candidatus Omnitrophota bacterium]
MARQARLDYPGCYHHVMGRGIDGLKIFYKETDKEDFLSRLKDIQKESSMKIHAWCIMDNHFHLLYQTEQTNLAAFMRKILTGYAINYNKRNKRRGYLFQSRYKSIVIDADEYYLPLVRYIHLNPVKAKVIAMSKLKEYAWTGHREIMAKQKEIVIDSEEILGYFGHGKEIALKAYEEYIAAGVDKEDKHLLGGVWEEAVKMGKEDMPLSVKRILGGGDFAAEILSRCEEEELSCREFTDADDLLYKISRLYNVARDALIEQKTKEVREARSVFMYLAVKKIGMSAKDAGRMLKIKESAASSGVNRGMIIEKEKGILRKLLNIN